MQPAPPDQPPQQRAPRTCTPPTVAGPIRILLFARAYAIIVLASFSGTPSAMTAITLTVACSSASMEDSNALGDWGGVVAWSCMDVCMGGCMGGCMGTLVHDC